MGKIEELGNRIISEGENVFDADEDSVDDKIMQILLNSQEQCQLMESMIKNQIEIKDQMIDKLHKELDYYKQDSADRFVEQLMKAVIKVRKDMLRLIESDKWDAMSGEAVKKEYQYIFEDLTDLLEQQNIDAYQTSPGEMFDASIHHAKTEQTDQPDLDKIIKESIAEGYKKGDKVLQPERVIVYQFKN